MVSADGKAADIGLVGVVDTDLDKAADTGLVGVVDTDLDKAVGTDPVEAVGTDPVEAVGTDPVEVADTDPVETVADTAPAETVADTAPAEAVDTDPAEAVDTDPAEAVDTDPAGAVDTDLAEAVDTDLAEAVVEEPLDFHNTDRTAFHLPLLNYNEYISFFYVFKNIETKLLFFIVCYTVFLLNILAYDSTNNTKQNRRIFKACNVSYSKCSKKEIGRCKYIK